MDKMKYEIIPLFSIIVGSIGSIFFGGATLLVFLLNTQKIFENAGESWIFIVTDLIFIFFLILSLYLLLYCQKIIISDESISIKRINKTYGLNYAEITYFYEGAGNINIGNDYKQISFPAYDYWNGRNKGEAYRYLITCLKERNVHPKISLKGIIPRLRGYYS